MEKYHKWKVFLKKGERVKVKGKRWGCVGWQTVPITG
jgi:hypothetical protein